MHKRELERLLFAWTKQRAESSGYKDYQTQRVYQIGLLVGLLASVCDDDFYARGQVLKKIQPPKP